MEIAEIKNPKPTKHSPVRETLVERLAMPLHTFKDVANSRIQDHFAIFDLLSMPTELAVLDFLLHVGAQVRGH